VANTDVASIIAHLLNVNFQPAQGGVRPCPFCR